MMKFISLLAIAFSLNVWADPSSPSQLKPPSVPTIDLMTNGSFEAGKASYTVSGPGGSTFSIDSSAPLNGKASGSFTSSAASQILSSPQYTIKEGLKGGACAASVFYKTTEGTNKYTFRVVDGSSNVLASDTLGPVSAGQSKALYFQCPSSGTIAAQVISSGTAAAVKLDDITLGKNNLIQISQASLYGTLTISGCSADFTNGNTGTMIGFGTNSGCTYTATGFASAPPTQTMSIQFASLPAGEYAIQTEGALSTTATNTLGALRYSDGTNLAREMSLLNSTTGGSTTPGIYQTISYTNAQSNVLLSLLGQVSTGSLNVGGLSNPIVIKVYRYPSSSELAVTPETINWKVDATVEGTINLSTGTVSSFSPIEDASLALVNTPVATILAQLPCSGTNPPTGLTCSAGNGSDGVSFILPAVQTVEVCADFTWIGSASTSIQPTFQIVETPANAQTVLQAGLTTFAPAISGAATQIAFPLTQCSILSFTSSGQKTLRLFYEQLQSGGSRSDIYANTPFASMHWRIKPITQNVPAPVLVNQPVAFHASSATPTISSAFPHGGTGAHIIFSSLGTEGYDTNSGLNLTTGFYSIPVAGLWTFTATTAITSTYDVGYEADAFIMKNGTVVSNGVARWSGVSTASTLHPTTTVTVFCSVGDQISFDADTNSSGSFGSSAGRNYFEGHLIR